MSYIRKRLIVPPFSVSDRTGRKRHTLVSPPNITETSRKSRVEAGQCLTKVLGFSHHCVKVTQLPAALEEAVPGESWDLFRSAETGSTNKVSLK